MNKPKVSFIVTTRNDNHGFALKRRTQLFLNTLFELAQDCQSNIELVIVEWNPPEDRPSIADEFDFSGAGQHCTVKIVTVPQAIHRRYRFAEVQPLYQMIAKNVGIRRAASDFVLATNIDVIFSRELFELLNNYEFHSGHIYRALRYDVDEAVPLEAPLHERLDYCRTHMIRCNFSGHSVVLESGNSPSFKSDWVDFELLWEGSGGVPRLSTNACGDFQLLHRDDWFKLHGYAEFDMQSFHIDSVLQVAAHFAGIKEVVFGEPFRFYHVEHEGGFRIDHQRFEESISKKGIRKLTDREFRKIVTEFTNKTRPIAVSDSNWGLCNEVLPECILGT